MANVLFKRGLHSALPTSTNIQDGVFYLTTDTNRLFIGKQLQSTDTPELVELNKSITVVDDINHLPALTDVEVGQFYYIKGAGTTQADNTHNGNILAVVVNDATTGKKWVQVNPDTNTDTGYNYIESTATVNGDGDGVVDPTNHRIAYTITLNQKHKDGSTVSNATEGNITATFYVNASDIGNIVAATSISVSSTAVSSNKTTITVSDSASNTSGSFTLAGGQNVTLSGGNGSDITIASKDTKYQLNSAANSKSITLRNTTDSVDVSTVNFAAGTALTISEATANTITYGHDAVSHTDTTGTAQTATNGTPITVVESVTVNTEGHVTDVTTKTVTAKDTKVQSTGTSISVSGENVTLSIGQNNSEPNITSTASGAIYHNLTIDGNPVKVSNQGTLSTDLVSTGALNTVIRGLNAMTYKGTVGTNGTVTSLPTSNVELGDTYMVKTDGVGSVSTSKIGDLYIAIGTEGDDGKITAATLTWEHVPAGADRDTTYTYAVASDGTINYTPSTGSSTKLAKIVGGTDLTVTGDTTNKNITINHDTITGLPATAQGTNATTSPAAGGTIKIPAITVNDRGHVTALSEATITLPADKDSKYALSTDSDTNSNTGKIVLTASGSSSGTTTAKIIGDGVVTVAGSGTGISIGHANKFTGTIESGNTTATFGPSANVTKASSAASATFSVPQVTVDQQGHVTLVTDRTITLNDKDTTYAWGGANLTTAAATNGASATITLVPSTGSNLTTSFSAVSAGESVKITAGNNGAINFEIEWGSF